ncbi:hypothetical protein [Rhodopirellula europaea]|uniref:hypothetical protein n=1 Tax=Rhodopirellula europaea TaxID=1263866 RepID=UPI0011818979|nr:hypothetical protein [Rhodopirellula europaea]
MKRATRLASAQSWLPEYTGKNVLRGYCKHFGVDWRCAAIDPEYLTQRETAEATEIRRRKERKQQRELKESARWHPYTDQVSAFLVGDFAALHDLQQREARIDLEFMPSCRERDASGLKLDEQWFA